MNIVRSERATVRFFDGLSIDGYRMPDGEFRVSMSGASVLIGFAPNWLIRTISRGATKAKALQGLGFSGQVKEVSFDTGTGGISRASTISLDDFKILFEYALKTKIKKNRKASTKKLDKRTYKNKRRQGSLTPSRRFSILKRDGYRCQLCGATARDGARLEIDHKHPVSKGGGNDPDNLWTLCHECNRGKGANLLY